MEPGRWQVIAERVSAPAAVATDERRVTLFLRGAGGDLLVLERDRNGWTAPRSLGIPLARVEGPGSPTVPVEWPIAACVTGPGEIQLVGRGPEGELVHATFRSGEWNGFDCIGSPANWIGGMAVPMGLASPPSVCSRAPGSMDVFAVGAAGALLHSQWNGKEFGEFESLGGIATAGRGDDPIPNGVAATSCGARAIAVVTRGAAGDLLVKWWSGASWTAFASVGLPEEPDPTYPAVPCQVPLSGLPVASGGGSTRLDVFARGQRGDLLHKWWDGKNWSRFESLGLPRSLKDGERIPFTGRSQTCVWGRFQLDVFARGSDGKLYGLSSNESGAMLPER